MCVIQGVRIPKKIKTKIALPASLADSQLRTGALLIISFLITESRKRIKKANGGKIQPYISMPRTLLRLLAGGNYKKSVDEVKALGIIQPHKGKKTGKESYKAQNLGDGSFSKKYKLSKTIEGEIRRGEITEIIKAVSAKKACEFKETAVVNCEATRKVVEMYKSIEIADFDNLKPMESLNLQAIAHGRTGARKGEKSGRISHRLTVANSKACRRKIRVDGEELNNVDTKSLHPSLLACFIKNEEEKKKWLKLCESDIYVWCAEGNADRRKEFKAIFQRAISNKRKSKEAARLIKKIETEFPALFSWIKEQWLSGVPVQRTLQRLEVSIFIPAFIAAPFWCLPIHDAFLVKESDQEKARNLISNYIFDKVGFEIEVK